MDAMKREMHEIRSSINESTAIKLTSEILCYPSKNVLWK